MLQVTPEVDSLESSDRIERIIRIGKSVDSSLLDKAACTEILFIFLRAKVTLSDEISMPYAFPCGQRCNICSKLAPPPQPMSSTLHSGCHCKHDIPHCANDACPVFILQSIILPKNLQASGNSVRSCLQSLSYSFVC